MNANLLLISTNPLIRRLYNGGHFAAASLLELEPHARDDVVLQIRGAFKSLDRVVGLPAWGVLFLHLPLSGVYIGALQDRLIDVVLILIVHRARLSRVQLSLLYRPGFADPVIM